MTRIKVDCERELSARVQVEQRQPFEYICDAALHHLVIAVDKASDSLTALAIAIGGDSEDMAQPKLPLLRLQ